MDDLAKAFKALSNKNRLEIFNLLRTEKYGCHIDECLDECKREKASCVTEIAERFNLAQSTVSHHLKELYNAGLIKMEREGLWVYCSVNEDMIRRIREYLSDNDQLHLQRAPEKNQGEIA